MDPTCTCSRGVKLMGTDVDQDRPGSGTEWQRDKSEVKSRGTDRGVDVPRVIPLPEGVQHPRLMQVGHASQVLRFQRQQ